MWKPTKPLFVLFLAVGVAATTSGAPVPEDQPGPLEGKYVLLAQTNTSSGPWGGARAPGARESSTFVRAASRRTTITQNTIDIDGQTTIWEYTLNPKVSPLAIDLTFTSLRGEKKKAIGIAEIKQNRLYLAYSDAGSERPKNFKEAQGVYLYVFEKAPPPPRTEYKIVALEVGKEAEAEKMLNRLAKEGYEVSHSTSPATPSQPGAQPVIHLILKRTVR